MSDSNTMHRVGTKLLMSEAGYTLFFCPACKSSHALSTAINGCTWNQSGDAPVFSPSVGVSGTSRINDENDEWTGEWNLDANGKPMSYYCHSFIGSSDGSTPGRIQFLSDCTHDLKNQIVNLPDYPETLI